MQWYSSSPLNLMMERFFSLTGSRPFVYQWEPVHQQVRRDHMGFVLVPGCWQCFSTYRLVTSWLVWCQLSTKIYEHPSPIKTIKVFCRDQGFESSIFQYKIKEVKVKHVVLDVGVAYLRNLLITSCLRLRIFRCMVFCFIFINTFLDGLICWLIVNYILLYDVRTQTCSIYHEQILGNLSATCVANVTND